MYGSVTWSMLARHQKQLSVYHMHRLRCILNIRCSPPRTAPFHLRSIGAMSHALTQPRPLHVWRENPERLVDPTYVSETCASIAWRYLCGQMGHVSPWSCILKTQISEGIQYGKAARKKEGKKNDVRWFLPCSRANVSAFHASSK